MIKLIISILLKIIFAALVVSILSVGVAMFALSFGKTEIENRLNEMVIENKKRQQTRVNIGRIVAMIEQNDLLISANGVMYSKDRESVLSTILKKWFDERVEYKNAMKKAFKAGNKEEGDLNHLRQYTMKILLNSLYGATTLPGFRYGLPESILSEAITLSGHRIIQESALCANKHMNKVIRGETKLKI